MKLKYLNPRPGGSYASNTKIVEHVVPDFTIRILDGELATYFKWKKCSRTYMFLEIYSEMLKGYKANKTKIKISERCSIIYKAKTRCC